MDVRFKACHPAEHDDGAPGDLKADGARPHVEGERAPLGPRAADGVDPARVPGSRMVVEAVLDAEQVASGQRRRLCFGRTFCPTSLFVL